MKPFCKCSKKLAPKKTFPVHWPEQKIRVSIPKFILIRVMIFQLLNTRSTIQSLLMGLYTQMQRESGLGRSAKEKKVLSKRITFTIKVRDTCEEQV